MTKIVTRISYWDGIADDDVSNYIDGKLQSCLTCKRKLTYENTGFVSHNGNRLCKYSYCLEWVCNCGNYHKYFQFRDYCVYCNDKRPNLNQNKSNCFITSATFNNLGITDDNCKELKEFRQFRDTYVLENYPNYIEEYYKIAPIIVDKIDNNKLEYSNIWVNYLNICLMSIREKEYEKAVIIYKKMIEELKEKYVN